MVLCQELSWQELLTADWLDRRIAAGTSAYAEWVPRRGHDTQGHFPHWSLSHEYSAGRLPFSVHMTLKRLAAFCIDSVHPILLQSPWLLA